MKTAQVLAVALVGVTSILLMGQQFPNGEMRYARGSSILSGGVQSPQPNAAGLGSASSQQSADAAAAHAYSLVVSEMRPVSGELEGKLNTQSAKPGDRVIVKITQSVMTVDGTEVPKGSRLLGHVIAARAYTKDVANSQLRIAFDRVELHGGKSIAIHSMIQSVAPPRREASDAGYDGAGAGMGSGSAMGGGAGGMGGQNSMGGQDGQDGLGGRAGGAVGAGAPGAGQVDTSRDRTAGGGNATNPMAANIPASMPGPMYGVLQLSDSLAPRYTGFPGVMLQADASGAASGTLFAANQNIRLDAGTRVVLGIVIPGN